LQHQTKTKPQKRKYIAMSTISKPAKKSAVNPAVVALMAAIKAIETLPAAPAFDREARRALIATAFEGLPERFIDSALDEAEKKHKETHGDNGERITRAVITTLAPAFGGLEEFAKVTRSMASEARKAGKVNVTGSEWRAALEGKEGTPPEHVSLAESASKLYKDGKPWSEIEESLNLSPASQQGLYLVSKDFPDYFPAKKTTATAGK
jgi:hypothetical protein